MGQSLTKTTGNFSTSLASLANNTSVIGGPWSTGGSGGTLASVFAATVSIEVGYINASAPTIPIQILIQGLVGTGNWVTVASIPGTQLALTTNTLAASGNGSTTVALTCTGTSTQPDFTRIFVYNSGTPANSEFQRTAHGVTASTTVNLCEALVNSQNSSVLFAPSEEIVTTIDMTPFSSLRLLIYNGTGNTVYWKSQVATGDSIG